VEKRQRERKLLGQNFLKSERLVQKLISLSTIGNEDVVYEIGPGRGIVTAELARVAKQVVAVEVDAALVRYLRERFRSISNVKIVECDFLQFRIHEKHFKVFANLPFGITARALSKLLDQQPIADEIFVVLQREAALKYTGNRGETVRSLLAKTRFSLKAIYRFRSDDFDPEPDVNAVLLKIKRLKHDAVPRHMYCEWQHFIRQGFCSWRPNLRIALKNRFSYKQWKHLSRELGFSLSAKPSELRFDQWLELFSHSKK
jgi:16S rRNA A1518/A1519 N6-dimethyltransferase RsmA/KsgA/DIM1 with predicted DNA glycosylase/AP lyase activity